MNEEASIRDMTTPIKKDVTKKKNTLNFLSEISPLPDFETKFQPLQEVISSEDMQEEVAEKNDGEANISLPDINDESFQDYLEQYDPLPRKYVRDIIFDEDKKFDHKYGVRHNPTLEKFYIGDSQLYINGSDIVVKNKTYKGTRGLYELLFKKHPKECTTADEKAYKNIVLKTNAHRRYYNASKQVDGSKLAKYKKIIAPLTTTATGTSGRGSLMEVTDHKIDYVHWDDPNELVERLRLLIASQQAGNTSHINEINSIVEELREAHIIV